MAVTITRAEVIVTCPGRNYVTLMLVTSDGVVGWGDATLNGRELAVASYLRDHLCPQLIGRDPAAVEDIWQSFYLGAYWRRGPVTMTSIAAVDVALWDIKGKALGTPVWNLLGGKVREGIPVYVHTSARELGDLVEQVLRERERGFSAIRIQCLAPGLSDMYGVPSAEGSKGERMRPVEHQGWRTDSYLRFVPTMFEAVRDAAGFDVSLLHDAHHRLSPVEAGWLGRRLEDYLPFWLEDPVPADLQESYRVVRSHTTTPLAVGEVLGSVWDTGLLVREQLIDFVRSSVVHAGGLSHLKKIAAHAEPYGVRTGCHGASDLSPVSTAAAAHFGASVHNAAIQEFMEHPKEAADVFHWGWHVQNGQLIPSDAAGIGVELDLTAAAKYPYRRDFLPTARKVDGSITAW